MDDYIRKPVDSRQLAEAIANLTVGADNNDDESDPSLNFKESNKMDNSNQSTHSNNYRLIDPEHARTQMGGCDDELLIQLVSILLQESKSRVAEIEQGLQDSDGKLVKRASHTLKSAAGYFDAASVVEFCGEIERLSDEEKLSEVPSTLSELKVQTAILESELQHYLDENLES